MTRPAKAALDGSQRWIVGGFVSLVATMSFHGRRTGNSVGGIGDVEAREFQFPVSLCTGCLIDCTGCDPPMCPVDTTDWAGGVCGNAQDRLLYPATCAAPM